MFAVDFNGQQFGFRFVGARKKFTLRAGDKTIAPEFDAIAVIRRRFVADAIAGSDRNAVGDGMRSLDGDPGLQLTGFFIITISPFHCFQTGPFKTGVWKLATQAPPNNMPISAGAVAPLSPQAVKVYQSHKSVSKENEISASTC